MNFFCNWESQGEAWVCPQCDTTIRKGGLPSAPVAVCPVALRSSKLSAEDFSQPRDETSKPPPPPGNGPGTELKAMLSRLGITSTPNCSCNQRAATMNAWGADVCEQRLDEIVGWLKEEATKRKLPFIETAARLLVKRAISNARKAQKPPLTE